MKHTSLSSKTYPKKSLGQHFLINTGVQEKIIEACQLQKSDTVLEIGPGTGVLTRRIAPLVKKVYAIEKDRELVVKLEKEFEGSPVELIGEDILKFEINKLEGPIKLVGNLPYYISTPIIENIIKHREKFSDVYIMVQLEYGQRLAALPNSREYGSLSCFVQLFMDPKILFKISPGSFNPPPKVQSCFMRLKVLPQTRFPVKDLDWFFKVLRNAFSQRRKTLQNCLKDLVEKEDWERVNKALGFKPGIRAEALSLEEFVSLAESLRKN